MTGVEIAIGVGSALVIAALGYGAKTVLGHGQKIAVLESVTGDIRTDVGETRTKVDCVDQKLQRLLGRQEERNGHIE